MASPPVDYYAALEVDSKASQAQIRDAYKRQALKHHPDRVPADSPERSTRTRKFQQINDAYYTLSDADRRREYDSARRGFGFGFGGGQSSSYEDDTADEQVPRQGPQPGTFPWSYFGFGGQAKTEGDAQEFSNQQFGGAFEEMMRDEGFAEGAEARPSSRFWSIVGAVSGGALGFIVANAPGAIAGVVAGNRLGNVRDTKGKSVYAVFSDLDQPAKMRILSELAQKVFSHAIG